MSKNKKRLLRLIAIFFIIEFGLSFFLDSTIVIGKDSLTGESGFRIVKEPLNLQAEIIEETQPDVFFRNSDEMQEMILKLRDETLSNADIIRLYQEEDNKEALYHLSHHVPYNSLGLYLTFHKFFGDGSTINSFKLLRMLLIIDLILIFLVVSIKRAVKFYPGKLQIVGETFYSGAEGMVRDTLGKDNVHFTPYLLTLFLFIWFSNLIGIIPIPGFTEPTRNLNVPLGLGLAAISVVHFMSIKKKGLWKYMKEYGEPMFFLAPLNI
ncbi:MAG: FoF1 ATP synthase subunit a, partial [Candidatus Zophobacter franzmannii]|nr:FoF1 ATP synthase subunit a [Candidatus Zophobacter franzmannii]